MATTDYPVGHPLAVKVWAKGLFEEALKQTHAKQFMGSSSNAAIHVQDELKKGPGDRVRVGLRMQLTADGVLGDNNLEGNEEALTTYNDDIFIDQLRNAVRSGGKMSDQRVSFSVREEARMGLADWYQDRIDTGWINQLAGNTAQTDTRYTGLNTITAPDASHIVYPDDATTEADVSSKSASAAMSLVWIDRCVEKAKTLTPPIRPLNINGKQRYAIVMHPEQVRALRTSTDTGNWLDINKSIIQGGQTSGNDILTGDLKGEYNGVLIYENTRVPLAPSLTDVRRSVFFGAQSCLMAVGRDSSNMEMRWFEELFDFGNQLGVAASMTWGIKRTIFNGESFAAIVLPTYSAAA